MSSRYFHIQQLIELWEGYEKENKMPDIRGFAEWLLKKRDVIKRPSEDTASDQKKLEFYPEFTPKQKISILLSRINRLQEFYLKKFFDGLIINNILEFVFLYSIIKNPGIKKSEVINHHLVEYTTGIDIIKRLKSFALITEYKDEIDKRSRKMKPTLDGKKIIMEAMLRINQVNEFFYNVIGQDDLTKLLGVFELLDNYHQYVYKQYNNKTYFELFKWIESKNQN